MGVGLQQKEDLREGRFKTFLHDLKKVRAAASHQAGPGANQGSRRKSDYFPGAELLGDSCPVLCVPVLHKDLGSRVSSERGGERGVGTSLWSYSLWDIPLLLHQQHHKPDRRPNT